MPYAKELLQNNIIALALTITICFHPGPVLTFGTDFPFWYLALHSGRHYKHLTFLLWEHHDFFQHQNRF